MNKVIKLLTVAGACGAISLTAFAASDSLAQRDLDAAPVSRELPWDGSETLTLEVPAHVRFVQSAGPGKVVVSGTRRSVEGFSASGGVLSDSRWRSGKPLDVVVHAPKITRFLLKGKDRLVVEAFDQAELTIETTGRSEVKASGQAGRVTLKLQGFGWVDLSSLAAAEADVDVTGARHALVAARDRARISGNGSVVLVGKAAALELALGESGRVFTLTP
jgi:Putative auto-transporter adhesin, head GIN domain